MPFLIGQLTPEAFAEVPPHDSGDVELGVISEGRGVTLAAAIHALAGGAIDSQDALDSTLVLLGRLTLAQLDAVKLTHIPAIQNLGRFFTVQQAVDVEARSRAYEADDFTIELTDAKPPAETLPGDDEVDYSGDPQNECRT
jgi:hypothetical protein